MAAILSRPQCVKSFSIRILFQSIVNNMKIRMYQLQLLAMQVPIPFSELGHAKHDNIHSSHGSEVCLEDTYGPGLLSFIGYN